MNYEKRLERAKEYYYDGGTPDYTRFALEDIFPELTESEDERIRTFLHHTFTAQYLCKDKLGKWHGEPVVNILAWLKKQGQKEWSEEEAKTLNRISAILVDASEVKNWWKEYRLIERDEMIRLTDFLKSLRPLRSTQ